MEEQHGFCAGQTSVFRNLETHLALIDLKKAYNSTPKYIMDDNRCPKRMESIRKKKKGEAQENIA